MTQQRVSVAISAGRGLQSHSRSGSRKLELSFDQVRFLGAILPSLELGRQTCMRTPMASLWKRAARRGFFSCVWNFDY